MFGSVEFAGDLISTKWREEHLSSSMKCKLRNVEETRKSSEGGVSFVKFHDLKADEGRGNSEVKL